MSRSACICDPIIPVAAADGTLYIVQFSILHLCSRYTTGEEYCMTGFINSDLVKIGVIERSVFDDYEYHQRPNYKILKGKTVQLEYFGINLKLLMSIDDMIISFVFNAYDDEYKYEFYHTTRKLPCLYENLRNQFNADKYNESANESMMVTGIWIIRHVCRLIRFVLRQRNKNSLPCLTGNRMVSNSDRLFEEDSLIIDDE